MRTALSAVLVAIVVVSGAVLFVTGTAAEDEATDELATARATAAEDARVLRQVRRHLAAARRAAADVPAVTDDLLASASATNAASRELLAANDLLLAAIAAADYDGYNAAAGQARAATDRRAAAQSPFSGDDAQLHGRAIEVDDALDAATDALARS